MTKPYVPKPYEVAGFELMGYRQADGSIKLGPEGKGVHLPNFPKEVAAFGVVYTLERVKRNIDLAPDLPEDHEGYSIEWGEYV